MKIPGLGFACKKYSRGKGYYWWVKSLRSGGKVKHRLIAYMGTNPTLRQAIKHFRGVEKDLKRRLLSPRSSVELAHLKRKIEKTGQRVEKLRRAMLAVRVQKMRTRRKLSREYNILGPSLRSPRQVFTAARQYFTYVRPAPDKIAEARKDAMSFDGRRFRKLGTGRKRHK